MDTTETYIKMCEKAGEIQEIKIKKRFPSHLVATYWRTTDGQIVDLDGDVLTEVKDTNNFSGKRYIWLPRQDQLQELLKYNSVWELCWNFARFTTLNTSDDKVMFQYTSMEQLWLAFFMRKEVGKDWKGGEWVCH